MATAPVRILIVDDHPIVRLGIRQMVSADPQLSVCGEADSLDRALALARSSQPDVALVDLSLEHQNGLEIIRALHEALPKLAVVVLSMHDEALFAERALKAGARGYIMKQEAVEGLVGAIHKVASGGIHVSDRLAQSFLQRLGGQAGPDRNIGSLTDRELEVFEAIGRGRNTGDIAADLGVSVKTVETYRSNIKAKLDLKDATELIRYATLWTERL